MRNHHKAQQTVEIVIIAGLVVVVCLTGLYYFGGSMATVFKDNPILSAFSTGNRTAVSPVDGAAKSFSFDIDGVTITSSVLNPASASGVSTVSTTGASGQAIQTAAAILDTTTKLLDLIKSGGIDANNPNVSNYLKTMIEMSASALALISADGTGTNMGLKAIVDNFKTAVSSTTAVNLKTSLVNSYKSKNASVANIEDVFQDVINGNTSCGADCNVAKIVKELEFQTDLQKGGVLAKKYDTAKKDMLSALSSSDASANKKTLIEVYAEDLQNLSTSITYELSSVVTAKIQQYYIEQIAIAKTGSDKIIELIFAGNATQIAEQKRLRDEQLNVFDFIGFQEYMNKLVADNTKVTTAPSPVSTVSSFLGSKSYMTSAGLVDTAKLVKFPDKSIINFSTSNSNEDAAITIDGITVFSASYDSWLFGVFDDYDYDINDTLSLGTQYDSSGREYYIFKSPSSTKPNVAYAIQTNIFPEDGGFEFNPGSIVMEIALDTTKTPAFDVNSYTSTQTVTKVGNSTPSAIQSLLNPINAISLNIPAAIKNMYGNGTLRASELEDTVHVYREGNFNEIISKSYDAKVLCGSIYGAGSNKCQ
jgi:hypothetical protein